MARSEAPRGERRAGTAGFAATPDGATARSGPAWVFFARPAVDHGDGSETASQTPRSVAKKPLYGPTSRP